MALTRGSELNWVPASHEDPARPGSLKKVLFTFSELSPGRVQMVNLGRIPAGESFRAHLHESMEEVFVVTKGVAEISINNEIFRLNEGDAVVVPAMSVHKMWSLEGDVDYVVFGIREVEGGKTVVVEGD